MWKNKFPSEKTNLAEIRLYFTHNGISRELQWTRETPVYFLKSLPSITSIIELYISISETKPVKSVWFKFCHCYNTNVFNFSVWTIVSATEFVSTRYNVFGLKLAQHISWRIKYFIDFVISVNGKQENPRKKIVIPSFYVLLDSAEWKLAGTGYWQILCYKNCLSSAWWISRIILLIIYSLVSNLYNLHLAVFQVLKGLDWAHSNILKEFECSAFMKHI